jgi:hypothetical protein
MKQRKIEREFGFDLQHKCGPSFQPSGQKSTEKKNKHENFKI